MQIVLDGRAATEYAVLALGMFDGVHIGHRVLLERGGALSRAAERSAGSLYVYQSSHGPCIARKKPADAEHL